MSIEKAKEFVRDNHGSTLKDDRMSDSAPSNRIATQNESETLEGIADRLGLDCDAYQNWDLLLDGIYHKIDQLTASPWISVEDRLPPDGMMVDVVSCNVRMTDVYFEDGKLAGDLQELVIGVTHWMPIPDSPK